MTKRLIALLLTLTLLLTGIPVEIGGVFASLYSFALAESVTIPEPMFTLPYSTLGREYTIGEWRYALREADGFAVITGHEGVFTEGAIPTVLDGCDVVGIAAGALPDAKKVTLHVNIMFIAEGTFSSQLQSVIAPNGSYGLYWASTHDKKYATGKDYDLVPGVIDFTNSGFHVQKHSDQYVAFSMPEALQLSIGSLFFMNDGRGQNYFYRVTELNTSGSKVIAAVEIPDLKDAIINLETTVELNNSAAVFHLADGVTFDNSPLTSRTLSQVSDTQTDTLSKKISGKTKKWGNNDGQTFNWEGSLTVDVTNTLTYNITITNGEIEETALTKNQSYSITPKISIQAADDLLKTYSNAEKALTKAANGEELNNEDKSNLQKVLGKIFEIDNLTHTSDADTYSFKRKDVEEWAKQIAANKEAIKNHSKVENDEHLGSMTFGTPYFMVTFSLDISMSIAGSISYTYMHTNITKEHYDKKTDEWVVDYTNGNASSNEDSQSFKFEIEGKVGIKVEISVASFFINGFSFTFELGIKASATKKFTLFSATPIGCTEVKIEPYLDMKLYAGLWIGQSTG